MLKNLGEPKPGLRLFEYRCGQKGLLEVKKEQRPISLTTVVLLTVTSVQGVFLFFFAKVTMITCTN